MIIKIEFSDGNKLLSGKMLSLEELNKTAKPLFGVYYGEVFVCSFCARLGFKDLPYTEGYADYIVDYQRQMIFVTPHTFPRELGGAKVLHFTESGEFAPVLSAGGSIAHKVYYLAVCKYENDPDYHLFHLDENLNVVADDCRESLEVCMNLTDAEWLCHKDRK